MHLASPSVASSLPFCNIRLHLLPKFAKHSIHNETRYSIAPPFFDQSPISDAAAPDTVMSCCKRYHTKVTLRKLSQQFREINRQRLCILHHEGKPQAYSTRSLQTSSGDVCRELPLRLARRCGRRGHVERHREAERSPRPPQWASLASQRILTDNRGLQARQLRVPMRLQPVHSRG